MKHCIFALTFFLFSLTAFANPRPIPSSQLPQYQKALLDAGIEDLECSLGHSLRFSSYHFDEGAVDRSGAQPALRFASYAIDSGGGLDKTEIEVITSPDLRSFQKVIFKQLKRFTVNRGTLVVPDYAFEWRMNYTSTCIPKPVLKESL
jgi:hypothetical protein